jgi:hypothetical protein
MSVLVVSNNINSDEVKYVKLLLSTLGVKIIRHQIVNQNALPDVHNLLIHDFAILIENRLSPKHIKIYRSYAKKVGIKNLKIY